MERYAKVINVADCTREGFQSAFEATVNTGKAETMGLASDFSGGIDESGRFYIVRGRALRDGVTTKDARLTGRIVGRTDDGALRIAYTVSRSPAFVTSFIALSLFSLLLIGYAVYSFLAADNPRPFLPASFFAVASLLMLAYFIIKPECRALERRLMKTAGESAKEDRKEEENG